MKSKKVRACEGIVANDPGSWIVKRGNRVSTVVESPSFDIR